MRVHFSFQRSIVGQIVITFIATFIFLLPCFAYAQDAETSNRITRVVWSPDANRIATSYRDGQITIISLGGQRDPLVLQADRSRILALAWSPDGRFLASGSGYPDNALRIWDTMSGDLVGTTANFGFDILSVVWSTDSQKIVAAAAEGLTSEGNAIVLDIGTEQVIFLSVGTVSDIQWSPDGTQLAFAHITRGIEVRDTITFQLLARYTINDETDRTGFLDQLINVVWNTQGTYFAGGMGDGRVLVWRVGTSEPIFTFEGNLYQGDNPTFAWINELRFDSSGQILTTVSGDGSIRRWDILAGRLLEEQLIIANYAADFSPYGGRLAIGLAATDVSDQTSAMGSPETVANRLVQILVPDPSPERLQAIAEQCGAPLTVERQVDTAIDAADMTSLIAQVEALPTGTIPPACAADLIAVAEAIQAQ